MIGDDVPTLIDNYGNKVSTSPCGSLLSDGPPGHIVWNQLFIHD